MSPPRYFPLPSEPHVFFPQKHSGDMRKSSFTVGHQIRCLNDECPFLDQLTFNQKVNIPHNVCVNIVKRNLTLLLCIGFTKITSKLHHTNSKLNTVWINTPDLSGVISNMRKELRYRPKATFGHGSQRVIQDLSLVANFGTRVSVVDRYRQEVMRSSTSRHGNVFVTEYQISQICAL